MADKVESQLVAPGTEGMLNGYPATVVSYYGDGMYEIRLPGGVVCVDITRFKATQS